MTIRPKSKIHSFRNRKPRTMSIWIIVQARGGTADRMRITQTTVLIQQITIQYRQIIIHFRQTTRTTRTKTRVRIKKATTKIQTAIISYRLMWVANLWFSRRLRTITRLFRRVVTRTRFWYDEALFWFNQCERTLNEKLIWGLAKIHT